MHLSDKVFEAFKQSNSKYELDKKKLLEKVIEQYDISPQDLFDLLYVGQQIYKQGAGLTYKQVFDILENS